MPYKQISTDPRMPIVGKLSAVVPRAGLEPARRFRHGILSPECLPFHHLGIEQI
jgi:hypothetical protein